MIDSATFLSAAVAVLCMVLAPPVEPAPATCQGPTQIPARQEGMRAVGLSPAEVLVHEEGGRVAGPSPRAAQTPNEVMVREVVGRAADNWGGSERVAAIRTLRAQFTYHEGDGPVTHDIGRPNLVRSTGGDRYVSVFDGKRAAFLRQMNRDGTP